MKPPAPVTTTWRPAQLGAGGKVFLDGFDEKLREGLLGEGPVAIGRNESARVVRIRLDLVLAERSANLPRAPRRSRRSAVDRNRPNEEGVEELLVDPAGEFHVFVRDS